MFKFNTKYIHYFGYINKLTFLFHILNFLDSSCLDADLSLINLYKKLIKYFTYLLAFRKGCNKEHKLNFSS